MKHNIKAIFSITVMVVFVTMIILFLLGAFKGDVMIIPEATIRTLLRLFIAYCLSLILAITLGMYCSFESNVAKIWLPIIDVLQTVPLLAFFPIAVELIVASLGATRLAYEIAAIFLIFTAMFWNLFYGIYDSINSIPNDLQTFTRVFRIPFLYALKYVYLPISIPSIISNSIVSWANGWFFIVLNEYLFYESKKFTQKDGLGVFIYNAFVEGKVNNIIIVILWISLLIIIFHIFIWEKLLLFSSKFKVSPVGENPVVKTTPTPKRSVSKIRATIDFLYKFSKHLIFIPYVIKIPRLSKISIFHFKPPSQYVQMIIFNIFKRASIILPIVISVFFITYLMLQAQHSSLSYIVKSISSFLFSIARITIAIFLSTVIALFINIYFRRNQLVEAYVIPVMQIIASIPVSIILPLVFFLTLNTLNTPEIGRVFILSFTAFWYIFFNIYAAFKKLPSEYETLADVYKIKGIHRYTNIYIPWILSSLLIGIHTGLCGATNAIIIVEYIEFGGKIYMTDGIGANLMYNYFSAKNMSKFSIDLTLLIGVITIYSFLFKKLLSFIENKYKYEY